jgi:septal ring factor EnvC (AmiA/AmiB activator)
MSQPQYKLEEKDDGRDVVEYITKDGHTMFLEDMVSDIKSLQAKLRHEAKCSNQLQEKCDDLRADKNDLKAKVAELVLLDEESMKNTNFDQGKIAELNRQIKAKELEAIIANIRAIAFDHMTGDEFCPFCDIMMNIRNAGAE